MSMSSQTENFESLRRLLAWKRHEQPPLGYFEGFSRQVILRLQSGEAVEEAPVGEFLWDAPWIRGLWSFFVARPAFGGAVGFVTLALLVAGGFLISRDDNLQAQGDPAAGVSLQAAVAPIPGSSGFVSSTNGLLPTAGGDSLFERASAMRSPAATLVSWPSPAAGN